MTFLFGKKKKNLAMIVKRKKNENYHFALLCFPGTNDRTKEGRLFLIGVVVFFFFYEIVNE